MIPTAEDGWSDGAGWAVAKAAWPGPVDDGAGAKSGADGDANCVGVGGCRGDNSSPERFARAVSATSSRKLGLKPRTAERTGVTVPEDEGVTAVLPVAGLTSSKGDGKAISLAKRYLDTSSASLLVRPASTAASSQVRSWSKLLAGKYSLSHLDTHLAAESTRYTSNTEYGRAH